jgi:hypothetical protein
MQQNLIFSRRADNGILSVDGIMQRAPSVFAEDKSGRLTSRYHSLNTSDLLPVLADYGYHPVQAAQKRARKGEQRHAAHMVAFAKDADGDGGLRSEIIAYNSHDGTSGVKLFAGAYRFICSNGIIAGEGFKANVRHTHRAMAGFEEMLQGIITSLPKMMDAIAALRQRRMDYDEAKELATKAVQLRWDFLEGAYVPDDMSKGTYATDKTVRDALSCQRREDDAFDAWTVLNRIQENVVRGNVMVRSITDRSQGERKARPIASIQEHVRVNQQLFDMVV